MFFKDQIKKRIKNEKGLTLIELLAVIVILAVIAAIAIPAIGSIINNQKDKSALAEASNVISTAKIAFTDGTCVIGTACSDTDMGFSIKKLATASVSKTVDATTKKESYTITYTVKDGFKGTKFALDGSKGVSEEDLNKAMESGVSK